MKTLKIAHLLVSLSLTYLLLGCSKIEMPKPIIDTLAIMSITESSAGSGGVISSDNGSRVTDRGICWSLKPNPTLKDSVIKDEGVGTGTFNIDLMNLNSSTTYYVRAFATNEGGTAYGDEKIFTTRSLTLTTISPTFIMATSAISGGLIAYDNNSSVAISKGVCWNTFPFPTISDSITIDGGGKGSFSSTMERLKPNTTYYIRAYLTNNSGTVYGNELSFTTQNGIIGISTDAASSITRTSANVAGTISGDGGANVTERGVFWSTSVNPVISGQKIIIGNGTGNFSKDMTDLTPNTTYYYCAFATNSIVTVFGNEVCYTTLAGVPKACFDFSISKMYNASFTNCSDYPTSCIWDFGDGATSTEKDPTHIYTSMGTYNVKLTVSNDGLTDLVTKTISISDEISLNNIQVASEFSNGTYLDVDFDGVADFRFATWINLAPQESNSYSKIEPLNNYEIITDTASTRVEDLNTNPIFSTYLSTIPRIYVLGNTIQPPYTTSKSGLYFANKQYLMVGKTTICDIWIKNEARYVGFRKIEGSTTKIGWIKLGVPGFTTIVLCSFKVPRITESLDIK